MFFHIKRSSRGVGRSFFVMVRTCISALLTLCVSVFGCQTDEDCSLLGDCQNSVCRCDPGWTGPKCGQVDLLPTEPKGGYRNESMASWCGSAVKEGGVYHFFGSGMTGNCPLINYFATNSMSIHGTSSSPGGPYKFEEVVLPPFHHSTAITRGTDGLMLFTIGKDMHGRNVHTCDPGRRTPTASRDQQFSEGELGPHDYMSISTAPSVEGPWKERVIFTTNASDPHAWNCNKSNPSAIVLNNGSILMMYRGVPCIRDKACRNKTSGLNICEHQGIAIAESVDAPFVDRQGMISELSGNEDAYLFQNKRGFVSLFHSKNACNDQAKGIDNSETCGSLAFSRDSWHWTLNEDPVYDGNIEWSGPAGTSTKAFLDSRQRPNILFADDGVTPLFLINGARERPGQKEFSLFAPFNVAENRQDLLEFI